MIPRKPTENRANERCCLRFSGMNQFCKVVNFGIVCWRNTRRGAGNGRSFGAIAEFKKRIRQIVSNSPVNKARKLNSKASSRYRLLVLNQPRKTYTCLDVNEIPLFLEENPVGYGTVSAKCSIKKVADRSVIPPQRVKVYINVRQHIQKAPSRETKLAREKLTRQRNNKIL